jgi:AcrR family transcriptional regulator
MLNRKRLGADRRREMIVAAALQLFADRGYHGVSLDEIAAEAGVTKPVIYDHAISKSDLYSGVLQRQHEELLSHIVEHLDDEGPLEERVRSALRTLFGWARHNPFAWRLLFGDDTTADADVAAIHRAVQSRASHEVSKRVLSGIRATSQEEVTRLEMIGEILGGATRSLIRWWHTHPDIPEEVLVETLVAVIWRGMASSVDNER